MYPLEGKKHVVESSSSVPFLMCLRFGDSALWRCIVVVASR